MAGIIILGAGMGGIKGPCPELLVPSEVAGSKSEGGGHTNTPVLLITPFVRPLAC